ncbi:hypothetical protein M5689_019073 [Euphorbia peplus]|nr:hypothetical protein M5689_019073 [Euphorbia peplus]
MDRRWMSQPRCNSEYRKGVEEFIQLALRNISNDGRIICPCVNCYNSFLQMSNVVREHLICDGFLKGYTRWVLHGEEFSSLSSFTFSNPIRHANVEHVQPCNNRRTPQLSNNITMLLGDALGLVDQVNDEGLDMDGLSKAVESEQDDIDGLGDEVGSEQGDVTFEEDDERVEGASEAEKIEFEALLETMGEELYLGCKTFSKLTFILHLYHLKCLNMWTNTSFTMLLELLIDAFPEGVHLPKSFYESKKLVKALGLDYEKIHSFMPKPLSNNGNSVDDVENRLGSKKKPSKILRYFPLIPRLQRLFSSTKTSNDMRWHEECRKKDGFLRHPADGGAWKGFNVRYSDFASDARNVRLALSSDGFNPYRTMSTSYSTWPVVLITYNMSPWSCMKRSSFILSMIIPGEKGPGNSIGTYLQPLVEELKQLWEGVQANEDIYVENIGTF